LTRDHLGFGQQVGRMMSALVGQASFGSPRSNKRDSQASAGRVAPPRVPRRGCAAATGDARTTITTAFGPGFLARPPMTPEARQRRPGRHLWIHGALNPRWPAEPRH
jgi:hypothetical protein